MSSSLALDRADLIVATLAGLAASIGVLAVFWPHLVQDVLGIRVRQLRAGASASWIRERKGHDAASQPSLRSEPRKLFKDIFDRLNLAEQAQDSAMVHRLRMAGYRGRGPVVTFIAIRGLTPIVLGAFTAFYIFVLLDLSHPLAVKCAIVLAGALLGYYLPAIYVKNRIDKRQLSIRRAWPDALDLLLICIEAGMGIEGALHKVAAEIGTQSKELAEELTLTVAELSYLPDRRKVYENLAERTGVDAVKGVVMALIQAENYGTSIGQSLRVLAQENRTKRLTEAEKKAAALAPKLTVPMIVFFLPVLFAVVITPAAIQIAKDL